MFNLIVFIKDTNALEVDEFFQGQHGKLTAKMRAGAADLSTPACTGSSVLQTGVPSSVLSNVRLILAHNLLDKSRLKK